MMAVHCESQIATRNLRRVVLEIADQLPDGWVAAIQPSGRPRWWAAHRGPQLGAPNLGPTSGGPAAGPPTTAITQIGQTVCRRLLLS